jgi:hypothetical protein
MARLVSEADGVNEDVLRYDIESGTLKSSPLREAAAKVSLAKREQARALAASDKRDWREDRTLKIAEDALSTAKDANRIASEDLAIARSSAESSRSSARWAMYAAIIATVAAAIAAKDQILALIFGSP